MAPLWVGCGLGVFKDSKPDKAVLSKRRPVGNGPGCEIIQAGAELNGESLPSFVECFNESGALTVLSDYLKNASASEKDTWATVLLELSASSSEKSSITAARLIDFERSLQMKILEADFPESSSKSQIDFQSLTDAFLNLPEEDQRLLFRELSKKETRTTLLGLADSGAHRTFSSHWWMLPVEDRRVLETSDDFLKILKNLTANDAPKFVLLLKALLSDQAQMAREILSFREVGKNSFNCKGGLKIGPLWQTALSEFRMLSSPAQLEQFLLGDGYLTLALYHPICEFPAGFQRSIQKIYKQWLEKGSTSSIEAIYKLLNHPEVEVERLFDSVIPALIRSGQPDYTRFLAEALGLASQLPDHLRTPGIIRFVLKLKENDLKFIVPLLVRLEGSGLWQHLFGEHEGLISQLLEEVKSHGRKKPRDLVLLLQALLKDDSTTYLTLAKDFTQLFSGKNPISETSSSALEDAVRSEALAVKKRSKDVEHIAQNLTSLVLGDFKIPRKDLLNSCAKIRWDLAPTVQSEAISRCFQLFPHMKKMGEIRNLMGAQWMDSFVESFVKAPFPEDSSENSKDYADFLLAQARDPQFSLYSALPILNSNSKQKSIFHWFAKNKQMSLDFIPFLPAVLDTVSVWEKMERAFQGQSENNSQVKLNQARKINFQNQSQRVLSILPEIECQSSRAPDQRRDQLPDQRRDQLPDQRRDQLWDQLEKPWVQSRWNRSEKLEYTEDEAKAKLAIVLERAFQPRNRAAVASFFARWDSLKLIQWLEKRAVKVSPILTLRKVEVDSGQTRMRLRVAMASSLDRFEQLLSEADFKFFFDYNFSMHFMKKIGLAWGDVPREQWPVRVQKYYGSKKAPKLRDVYEEMRDLVSRYAALGAVPSLPSCASKSALKSGLFPPIPEAWWSLPHKLVDQDIQMRAFALSQVLPVVEENLPDAVGDERGGMILLRDLFYSFLEQSKVKWSDADLPSEDSPFRWIQTLSDSGAFRALTKLILDGPFKDVEGTYGQVLDEVATLSKRPWFTSVSRAQVRSALDLAWGRPAQIFAGILAVQGADPSREALLDLLERQPEFLDPKVQWRILDLFLAAARARQTQDLQKAYVRLPQARARFARGINSVFENREFTALLGKKLATGQLSVEWLSEAMEWVRKSPGGKGSEASRWLSLFKHETSRPVVQKLIADLISQPDRADLIVSQLEQLLRDPNSKNWLNRIDRNVTR